MRFFQNQIQKFRKFKSAFIRSDKNEVDEAIGAEIKKREELELTVAVLQHYVKTFWKQMMVLQGENEELEQYGRSLCIRVKGVPTSDYEKIERSFKESKFSH